MRHQADGWMVELYCDDGEWRPVGEPIATRARARELKKLLTPVVRRKRGVTAARVVRAYGMLQ